MESLNNRYDVKFSKLDLININSLLYFDPEPANYCDFNIIGDKCTWIYRFKWAFYGLTDIPAEFQKAMYCTLACLTNIYFFLF